MSDVTYEDLMNSHSEPFRGTLPSDPLRPANRFELQCVRTYVFNALTRSRRTASNNLALLAWLAEHHAAVGIELSGAATARQAQKEPVLSWSDALDAVVAACAAQAPVPPSALEIRLRWIAAATKLTSREAAILKLAVRSAVHPVVRALATHAYGSGTADEGEINARSIAALLNCSHGAVGRLLMRSSPLLQFGLLEDRGANDYAPSNLVMRIARSRFRDPARLREQLFGGSAVSDLDPADFDHIGEPRRIVTSLVRAALEKHERGVGVLLYGAPGTGKTEFAKVLAHEVGATAVFIGEASQEDGGEPTRSGRIAHLTLTSALAEKAGRVVLVVDEADDIFTGVDVDDRASRTGSKVFMNRLVETCVAPTIWITNNPRRLGPAVMRRMAFAIRFPEPGRSVRRRMVERLAAKHNLKLDSSDLGRLERIEAAPALIDAGLRAAALTGGGTESAIVCTESLRTALGSRCTEALVNPVPFDPALSAADCDLAVLAERARASFAAGETALSFCFHGLPGTGKSAYARFLAQRLDVEVIERRASDILSMWVGGTEQNIAEAFRDAADRRAMLVIDEADSLLQDRAGAQRSWEVTQVNEMLTWMERHPFPLVCTTNAIDALDRATMRRFLFKVEFLPMTIGQARETFRRAFGVEPPSALDRLDPLMPGDFAVVARKVKVIRESDPARLVAMLTTEVAAKQRSAKYSIGFC